MDLATYLRRNGLTAAEFAKQFGWSKSFVSRLVKGERTPSVKTAKEITAATAGAVPLHILRPDVWDSPKRRAA